MKHARVQLQGQPSAYAAIIAEKNIYRIDEVYGVSFFDLDAIREDNVLRNGIEADEREHQYLVRGLFGDSKADAAKLPGTRWVKLRDIHLRGVRRGRGHIGARGCGRGETEHSKPDADGRVPWSAIVSKCPYPLRKGPCRLPWGSPRERGLVPRPRCVLSVSG